MTRITVIGAGYVGLVTAAGFAHLGHTVAALETDRHRLASLREGRVPIHEPGLGDLVAGSVAARRLEFGDDYASVIPSSDYVFLAVNTPPRADGSADTSFVLAAVRRLLEFARPGLVIVTKSTVPVGTGDEIEALISEAGIDRIHVASNPEFLREGSAVEDFFRPDRIVVGADEPGIAARVAELYEGVGAPVLLTSQRSAELAKYAANALLATRISFINEVASISEAVGADVDEVARIVGADSRIGPRFLQAGLGWGGSCLPKDLSALAATARQRGRRTPILDAVVHVNARQRERAAELLLSATAGSPAPAVAVLGLTFKPETDDLRGSPALDVIARLLERGARVHAHDPQALGQARLLLPTVHFAPDPYEVMAGVDAVLLATEWPEYLQLDWARIRGAMRGSLILDGRNVLHGGLLRRLGFEYRSFGRTAHPRPAVRAVRARVDVAEIAGSEAFEPTSPNRTPNAVA
jgi:UDPglucose 6-dehydrogenase